jgi:hypothetical protein
VCIKQAVNWVKDKKRMSATSRKIEMGFTVGQGREMDTSRDEGADGRTRDKHSVGVGVQKRVEDAGLQLARSRVACWSLFGVPGEIPPRHMEMRDLV